MHAGAARGVDARQRVAGNIGDDQSHVARRARRETIDDIRAERRVRICHLGLCITVARKVELRAFAPLIRRLRLEQVRVLCDHFRRHLLERGAVHDPQTAAVRRRDHLVIARMNLQIEHRHGRQIRRQPAPRLAAIAALVEVGLEVAGLVIVERRVDGVRIECGCLQM